MTASPSQPPNSPSGAQSKTHSKARNPAAPGPQPDDFYTLLGLRPGASVQDIRRAYRDLSKLYHPDTTELESAIATVKFQALNEAYATLSSPEKRLTYDYKIGYSRISVMQPLSQQAPSGKAYNPTDSAYLDPTDRPLSAGELFALFILGITFVACLILVFTLGLTKSELPITQGASYLQESPAVESTQSVAPGLSNIGTSNPELSDIEIPMAATPKIEPVAPPSIENSGAVPGF